MYPVDSCPPDRWFTLLITLSTVLNNRAQNNSLLKNDVISTPMQSRLGVFLLFCVTDWIEETIIVLSLLWTDRGSNLRPEVSMLTILHSELGLVWTYFTGDRPFNFKGGLCFPPARTFSLDRTPIWLLLPFTWTIGIFFKCCK